MMMTTTSNILIVLVLSLCSPLAVEATRLAFHFDGTEHGHAGCRSSTYDVDLGEVKFICDSGEDLCRAGDSVTLQGWLYANKPLPVDMTRRFKICKWRGTMCTSVLDYAADSFANDWHLYSMYSNVTSPNPGYYGFEKRFILPESSLTDFPWAGFTFEMTIDIQAEDTGNDWTHMRCHAHFTTVNYDSFKEDGSTGSGFSSQFGSWGVSMIGLVGLGATAGWMERKRRQRKPKLTLDGPVYPSCTTQFEMMACGDDTDGERASARV